MYLKLAQMDEFYRK